MTQFTHENLNAGITKSENLKHRGRQRDYVNLLYQTRKTVFDHISKPLEGCQKHSPTRRIITLFSVFGKMVKHGLSCSIDLLTRY